VTRWGIVSTIKADAPTILRFAAYHLNAGAHRMYIYLDAPCPSRQTVNATFAYGRAGDVDWLAHIDVDEFLVAPAGIEDVLAAQAPEVQTVRARPMELLAGGTDAFKRFIPAGPDREHIVAGLYPTYGEHLKGGFLSHLAGKVFLRTGLDAVKFRIHNAFAGEVMNPNEVEPPALSLAHLHATSWEAWLAHYRYRLEKGSYRADLGPARARHLGGVTLHEVFQAIESEGGEDGLRHFFEEVVADSPALRARLAAADLLHVVDLDLDATKGRHFPQTGL